jgi:predicted hydrocarbon binding protein
MFSKLHSQRITTSTKDDIHYWRIESCVECQGAHMDPGMCSFYLGFAQEFLAWIGSGKAFLVDEVECISRGANACLIEIDLTPVE